MKKFFKNDGYFHLINSFNPQKEEIIAHDHHTSGAILLHRIRLLLNGRASHQPNLTTMMAKICCSCSLALN